MENSPLHERPQQIECGIELNWIGAAKISWRYEIFTKFCSLLLSHSLIFVLTCDTVSEVSSTNVSVISIKTTSDLLTHQLSN